MISLIVLTINSHSCNDLREKLMFFVTTFFEENPNLINQNILEILFTPFENIMKGDSIKIIISNAYLFKLIRLAAKIDERILTNGYLYNKRKYKNIFHLGSSNNSLERSNSNIPQLIIDITILMLRNYINTSEKTQIVDNLVLTLMDCCENIYDSHPVFYLIL
ncbi:hypothetical protein HHI36_009521 [Cryptolaemus montrouzieri]|uniref:Uncharacterized protein n=1 Tax=Cryptolaemus montrouzieri TaxID=559131 RepID=A0ABD2MFX4_9CUCU